jgi:hypothetical protein
VIGLPGVALRPREAAEPAQCLWHHRSEQPASNLLVAGVVGTLVAMAALPMLPPMTLAIDAPAQASSAWIAHRSALSVGFGTFMGPGGELFLADRANGYCPGGWEESTFPVWEISVRSADGHCPGRWEESTLTVWGIFLRSAFSAGVEAARGG